MPAEWFVVDQPDPRFRAEGLRLVGPFYCARILDTSTGSYLPLARGGMYLLGLSSLRRAVKYGIERQLRSSR